MGIKIKKDTMPRLEDLPVLKIRYTMAIPLIGIVAVSYTHLDVYKRQ